jgi:hypothetical protein
MSTTEPALRISSNPKSFFLYLLAIIMLYSVVISFTGLLFTYINIVLPYTLDNRYFNSHYFIRSNITVLLISFPLYLILFSFIRRQYLKFPEQKALIIRKWAAYFTLFVAAVTIWGDLIVLVDCFLSGDLTLRFVLKTVVIFLVFGWLFYFTLRDLKLSWQSFALKLTALLSTAIVIATIAYGFTIIGSPFNARLVNLDRQRVTDLTRIQQQIVQYWRDKHELPARLDNLTSAISGFKAPIDPQTHQAYEYKVLSKLAFELCATFDLAANDSANPATAYQPLWTSWNWQHPAGRYCFQRTIDPQQVKK